jgi:hypothetical protein
MTRTIHRNALVEDVTAFSLAITFVTEATVHPGMYAIVLITSPPPYPLSVVGCSGFGEREGKLYMSAIAEKPTVLQETAPAVT